MNSPQVLMIGCGDIGTRASTALAAQGWRVAGVRRNPQQLPASIQPFVGDYTCADGLSAVSMLRPDYIVFSPLPAGRDAAGYQRGYFEAIHHIVASGVAERAARLVFISSTRVYAESDGGWVDETSPLTTTDAAALAIIAAENAAAEVCPTTVLRASGIYGDIPGMLLRRVLSGEGSDDPSRWSNRIHRQDLADIVVQVLLRDAAGETVPALLNASDDTPSRLMDVEQGLADALQQSLKPTASARQARANRRCSNRLLHATGFSLQYPNWQTGYRAVLSDLAAQSVYQPDLAALQTPSLIKGPK